MTQFPSFRTRRPPVVHRESAYEDAKVELGEIHDNLVSSKSNQKFRADIRTWSGALLRGVRLPGPRYSSAGELTGHKPAYFKGQLVLVSYINGHLSDPIVVHVFPHPGGDSTRQNLSKNTDYDPEEVAVGHGEGVPVKTIWEDGKIKFLDPRSPDTPLMELNFASNFAKIDTGAVDIDASEEVTVDSPSIETDSDTTKIGGGRTGTAVQAIFESGKIKFVAPGAPGTPLLQIDIASGKVSIGPNADEGLVFGNKLYDHLQEIKQYLVRVDTHLPVCVTQPFTPWASGSTPTLPPEDDLVSDKHKVES